MKTKLFFYGLLTLATMQQANAQSELYPKHFDLEEVTLLDGPMKTAMDLNIQMLLQYDVDRLLTPYVRQSGLADTQDASSPYYQWLTKHPNFKNWGGDAGFDLSGHVGGHYLSALALAYAACHDAQMQKVLKERMDYMLKVMKDCQDQYDNNQEGLYGFIGGQPINDSWKALYQGDLSKIQKNWGWVPFYCQHKILAGLRDAYLYGNSKEAKEMFREKLRDLMKYIPYRGITYTTNFADEVLSMEWKDSELENDDLQNYKEKVEFYIRQHQDSGVIAKLRGNIPLTKEDVSELEELLWKQLGSKEDYEKQCGNKPLGAFVRSIVGMDMNAAKEAFSEYLNDVNLDERQIYFVNQIVEYIVQNGMITDMSVLQSAPFTNMGSVVEVFSDLTLWMKIKGTIQKININANVA